MSLDLSKYDGHTPGPWKWKAEYSFDDHLEYHSIKSDSNHLNFIASTWGGPHAPNAALIADAPQLLAELREARAENEKLRTSLEEIAKCFPVGEDPEMLSPEEEQLYGIAKCAKDALALTRKDA